MNTSQIRVKSCNKKLSDSTRLIIQLNMILIAESEIRGMVAQEPKFMGPNAFGPFKGADLKNQCYIRPCSKQNEGAP